VEGNAVVAKKKPNPFAKGGKGGKGDKKCPDCGKPMSMHKGGKCPGGGKY
jgi:hypothetical protein